MVLFWCIQAAGDARFGSKGVGVSLCRGLNACRGVAWSEGCTAAPSLLFLFSLAQTCAAVTCNFSTYQPYLKCLKNVAGINCFITLTLIFIIINCSEPSQN